MDTYTDDLTEFSFKFGCRNGYKNIVDRCIKKGLPVTHEHFLIALDKNDYELVEILIQSHNIPIDFKFAEILVLANKHSESARVLQHLVDNNYQFSRDDSHKNDYFILHRINWEFYILELLVQIGCYPKPGSYQSTCIIDRAIRSTRSINETAIISMFLDVMCNQINIEEIFTSIIRHNPMLYVQVLYYVKEKKLTITNRVLSELVEVKDFLPSPFYDPRRFPIQISIRDMEKCVRCIVVEVNPSVLKNADGNELNSMLSSCITPGNICMESSSVLIRSGAILDEAIKMIHIEMTDEEKSNLINLINEINWWRRKRIFLVRYKGTSSNLIDIHNMDYSLFRNICSFL